MLAKKHASMAVAPTKAVTMRLTMNKLAYDTVPSPYRTIITRSWDMINPPKQSPPKSRMFLRFSKLLDVEIANAAKKIKKINWIWRGGSYGTEVKEPPIYS